MARYSPPPRPSPVTNRTEAGSGGRPLRWMRGDRRGIKRAASAPAVEQVRRPVRRSRDGYFVLRGMRVYWTLGYWARPGCMINLTPLRAVPMAETTRTVQETTSAKIIYRNYPVQWKSLRAINISFFPFSLLVPSFLRYFLSYPSLPATFWRTHAGVARERTHTTVWARSLHGLHGDAAEREPAHWQVRQGSRRGQTRAVWATAADLRGLGGCKRPADGGVAYADARGLCDNGATYPMTA
jgi:hypothetical protein